MDFNDTLDELNITLGDTENVTFTPEEKQRALKKAWNDSYVVVTVLDDSTVFATGTYTYAIPQTVTTVKDLFVASTAAPEPIDTDWWDVVGTDLHLTHLANITSGRAITIKGNYKLDPEFDTLDTPALQEYVIALAAYNTLALLTFKKANLFLKNDTTMSELIALRREMLNEVREGRLRLQKEYESA